MLFRCEAVLLTTKLPPTFHLHGRSIKSVWDLGGSHILRLHRTS